MLQLAAGGVGGALAHLISRREWQLRKFLSRVNLSLNIITPTVRKDGSVEYSLKIRTIFEKDISDIFLRNRSMVCLN